MQSSYCSRMQNHIRFNFPAVLGNERCYVEKAIAQGMTSGDGHFSKRVQGWFQDEWGLQVLPTPSCSAALEMAALLCGLGPDDDFIVPSYTFVSTANAGVLRGARPRFADSAPTCPHPGLAEIQAAWTPATRAVFVVHYAGVSHELPAIAAWCKEKGLWLIEDAAQAIGSTERNALGEDQPLGSWGQWGAFSFHETKNIQCGEGGCLVVNDPSAWGRAQIVWEKGTNRQSFFRGEVDKYGWVEVGSSFLPNELTMAFLLGQLEVMQRVTERRKAIWHAYYDAFSPSLPAEQLPPSTWRSKTNGHLFYLCAEDVNQRQSWIQTLKQHGIATHFHYQSLRDSSLAENRGWQMADMPNARRFSDALLRLPLHLQLQDEQVDRIIETVLRVCR